MMNTPDDQLNIKAANLQIAKAEIELEINSYLNIGNKLMSLEEIKNRVEIFLFSTAFEKIRVKVLQAAGSSEKEFSNEQIQSFMRNFIIEPLLEEHYQKILEVVKRKIGQEFIKNFPLTTVVVEPLAQMSLGISAPKKEEIIARLQNFAPRINIEDFTPTYLECTVDILSEEELVSRDKQLKARKDKIVQDLTQCVLIVDYNCDLLETLCHKIFKAIVTNYGIDKFKFGEELKKLTNDFHFYVKNVIASDSRSVGKVSPKFIRKQYEAACSNFWDQREEILQSELDRMIKKRPLIGCAMKTFVWENNKKSLDAELSAILNKNLGCEPKSKIFSYAAKKEAMTQVETAIKEYEKKVAPIIQENAELMLELSIKVIKHHFTGDVPSICWAFPDLEELYCMDVLTMANRKAIALGLASCSPYTNIEADFKDYYATVASAAEILGIDKEPEVAEMLVVISTSKSREENSDKVKEYKEKCTKQFDNCTTIDMKRMVWLTTCLYMLIVEGWEELQMAAVDYKAQKPFQYGPLNFRRRDMMFELVRSIRNGAQPILNFQIVLLVESALETFRYEHNKQLCPPPQKSGHFPISYNADYEKTVEYFRALSVEDMAQVIENSSIASKNPPQDFVSKFVSDLWFDKTPKKVDGVKVQEVDVTKSVLQSIDNSLKQLIDSNIIQQNTINKMLNVQLEEEDATMKLRGKVKYLKEEVKTFELENISMSKKIRSRVPTLVISGFLSEADNAAKEWRQLVRGFALTELISMNWKSFTIFRTFTQSFKALGKLSFKDLTGMFVDSLYDILPGSGSKDQPKLEPTPEAAPGSNPFEDDDGPGAITNPFQVLDNNFSETDADDKTVATKKLMNEVNEEKQSKGLFCLLKKNRFKNIFSREALTKAAIQMTKLPASIELQKNPEYRKLVSTLPAFAMTTGVYDFYKVNPFSEANHHAVMTGQMLALLIGKANIFNGNPVNLMCYSLGSVFVMSTCLTLYDLGCTNRLGDVCFMGACNDLQLFAQSLHKLIGSKGVVQGKLIVMYSIYDTILAYIFKAVRLGEVPLGYKRMNLEYLADCMKSNDPAFKDLPKDQVMKYIESRMDNLDVSEQCENHFVFKYRLRKMLPMFKFGGDFKESQSFAFFDDTK
jgi:hypothetical protein